MALRRVFTYLGAVFLMSHIIFSFNASAIETVYDMTNYEPGFRQLFTNVDCLFNTTAVNNVAWCQTPTSLIDGPTNFNKIVMHTSRDFKAGDIVEFYVVILSSFNGEYFRVVTSTPASTANVRLINFKDVTDNTNVDIQQLDINTGEISSGIYVNKVYQYTYYVVSDFSGQFGLQSYDYTNRPLYSFNGILTFGIIDFTIYRPIGDGSSKDQQNEINATNDSVQQSEDAGADSESDAQTGTASLISTIGSAVSAITSASPTNCLLNGNMGNFDMGQIDLCSNPVPTFVQIISSLILILITVPLCIVMFNRFIGLFRSFQG